MYYITVIIYNLTTGVSVIFEMMILVIVQSNQFTKCMLMQFIAYLKDNMVLNLNISKKYKSYTKP